MRYMPDEWEPKRRHHKGFSNVCRLPRRAARVKTRFFLRRILGYMRGQESREDCWYMRRIDLSKAKYEPHCAEVLRLAYLSHLPMYQTASEYETFIPEDMRIY